MLLEWLGIGAVSLLIAYVCLFLMLKILFPRKW